MKRLLPTGLVLLLVMSSLGHVLAATFCPRSLGRDCCLAKTQGAALTRENRPVREMPIGDMSMDGMKMDDMNADEMGMVRGSVAETSMEDMALNGSMMSASDADKFMMASEQSYTEEVVGNSFDQSIESCPHCLVHSGVINAPFSFVTVWDRSGKDIGPEVLQTSRFLNRPAVAFAKTGMPREHAPPSGSAPRYILVSVFQI